MHRAQPESDDTTPAVPMNSRMPVELQIFCQEMRADMMDVKTALIGNKYQTGLIPRVDKIEEVQEAHSKKLLVWGSLISAAGTVLVFLKDFLHKSSP